MSKRVVITKQNIAEGEYLVTALLEDHRMIEVSCDDIAKDTLLGNVYIAKIKRILEKIGAVFVELAPGQMGYLPFKDVKEPMMAKQCRPGKLTEEDEIVVQVIREAIKTKYPTVSTNISLKGNAIVLTTEDKLLGVSKKLNSEQRCHFRGLLEGKKDDRFGLVIRTNARNYSDEQLLAEFQVIYKRFCLLEEQHKSRTCYSCLYHAPSSYISSVRDHLSMKLEKIVTDDLKIYEEICLEFQNEASIAKEQIIYYQDPLLSLSALYGLKSKLEGALRERVWLKSGAYLVISPTEALTVIDVNSGRCIKGKQKDFYLKINLEAAEEIAMQLRLRNISGICIVDFINLETKEEQEELARALKTYLAKDIVPTVFVDFTRLGLAEITRKKVKKPLWEQVEKRTSLH